MYLLDTNIISEMRLAAKGRGDPALMAWANCYEESLFYTNIVVLMEIERGILNVEKRDPAQASTLNQWLTNTVKQAFKGRVLTLDEGTASICASLHIPDRTPENDAWIAASAIQHDLTLVTRNVQDFQHPHLRVFNPFA